MTSNQESKAQAQPTQPTTCCHHQDHPCDLHTREPEASREAREDTIGRRMVNLLKDINRYLVCDIHKMECWLADEAEAKAQEAKAEPKATVVYKLEPTS